MTSRRVGPRSARDKVSARLADGREIIYFDETVDAPRVLDRSPGPARGRADVRDPLRRPASTSGSASPATARPAPTIRRPRPARCARPRRANPSEIPSPDYDVVVFENRFPSFAGSRGRRHVGGCRSSIEPGHGRCEVVCFTSDHTATFSSLTPHRVSHRAGRLDRPDRGDVGDSRSVQQVFCFENRGVEIGVTLAHPHGQIYGYPFVTPRTAADATVGRRPTWRRPAATCSPSSWPASWRTSTRIVAQNEHWVAFVPFAARWPIEVHLYPRTRVPDLPALDEDQRAALPADLPRGAAPDGGGVRRHLPGHLGVAPGAGAHRPGRFWLHLEVFSIRRAVGKLKFLAGSESAMDAFVNDIAPEVAGGAAARCGPDRSNERECA